MTAQTTDLLPSISIANFVHQRNAVMSRIEQAMALLQEAQKIAEEANLGIPCITVEESNWITSRPVMMGLSPDAQLAMERLRRAVDSGAWNHLLSASGLRSLMDAISRGRWDDQIKRKDVPEMTQENVAATFGAMYEARDAMFRGGVVQCFERLYGRYASNRPTGFGNRLVMTRFVEFETPSIDGCNQIDDLMRVFHVLDGRPEVDHRQATHKAVMARWLNRERVVTNDYLTLQWFKNGNAHLSFRRADLVDRLNRILAEHYGATLAAPRCAPSSSR